MKHGILRDDKRVEVVDVSTPELFLKWAEVLNGMMGRRVRWTLLSKRRNIYVSTVFLAMDHSWVDGVELWFETMIFGTSISERQDRYTTWREAELGHERMVFQARQARQLPYARYDMKKFRKRMTKVRW